jgi:hypothetical protein
MRHLPLIRAVVASLAAATLLAACGADKSPQVSLQPSSSPVTQTEREYDLDATAQTAATRLGGHAAAAYAVLSAADNGYSPYQTATAIDAGLLDESGAIQGVAPALPAGDAISDGGGVRFLLAAAGAAAGVVAEVGGGVSTRGDLEQMFTVVGDQVTSGRWLAWVLGATGAGYSAGQVAGYLGQLGPPRQVIPPTIGGVPVVRDVNGDLVSPELGADWPYRGRTALRDLQQDPDLGFDDNLAVLVIGLVNAGYTVAEIEEAVRWGRIGLCVTQDGTAFTVGCVDEAGQLMAPTTASPGSLTPARVVIADVTTLWPTETASSSPSPAAGEDAAAKLQSGEKVSLKLTPYLAQKDTGLAITSHDVVMDIEPAGTGSYHISCRWKITLVQETDDAKRAKGSTYICEGEAYDEENDPMPLDRIYRLRFDFTYHAYRPDGEYDYTVTDSLVGFSGSLNEYLEGDGTIGSVGPGLLNWDTYPVDE